LDSNQRPLEPHSSALPGLRYIPTQVSNFSFLLSLARKNFLSHKALPCIHLSITPKLIVMQLT
ncbi:MAG: hypothetical protein JXR56_01915, partial [Candidatus Cloacimonetes bacterium]|nr:hypothetical protein [Candidatus Cloacimonadota bacterium]